ncbi:MAG TPA: DUF2279 domain-containing protein [Kofleriaceae bacterium]|nr:DUF2279 domain-containing protein [Kofleriaceae bacterium]
MWLACLALVLLAWWRAKRTDGEPKPEREREPPREPRPAAAVGTLAAAYAIFVAWTFVAWYRKHYPLDKFKWGGDGWMGENTYAGGADKCGHAWATMSLARLGTVILHGWGGFAKRKASLISAGLAELLFTGVEVKDGFYYEFSFSDFTGNSIGAVMAALLDNFPRLNELFSYRVQYEPSEMYERKVAGTSPCPPGGCSRWNIAEDYSGETYLAAFHLGGIRAVRDRIGSASRFVDFAVGFDSRNYKPHPDPDVTDPPHQDLFLGLAFNAQGFLDWLLEDRPAKAARRAQRITHGLFEVFNAPYGSVRLVEWSRAAKIKPPSQGA